MKFEVYQDALRQWRWRLKAANGETIASGEGYKDKQDCINAIDLIAEGAATARVEFVER